MEGLRQFNQDLDSMVKRLLNDSPREMLSLASRELFQAIKMSEGRIVIGDARVRGCNLVQYVCNAEVCAAFGSDIVAINAYNPQRPMFPGLPSKNPEDDEPFREIQVPIGRGWSAREVRALIGRPLMTSLLAAPSYGGGMVDTGFTEAKGDTIAGAALITKKNVELVVEQGFDILALYGWCEEKDLIEHVRETKKLVGDRILIESGVPHGPGLIYAKNSPYQLRDLIGPDYAIKLVKAGADIIQIPAVGSLPGFTPEHVGAIIDAVHAEGALVTVGIHNSQEGTDIETIRRIAIDNKTLGADMQMLGDAGLNENMGLPETIMALCIALKGHRHTYRRMTESVMR